MPSSDETVVALPERVAELERIVDMMSERDREMSGQMEALQTSMQSLQQHSLQSILHVHEARLRDRDEMLAIISAPSSQPSFTEPSSQTVQTAGLESGTKRSADEAADSLASKRARIG